MIGTVPCKSCYHCPCIPSMGILTYLSNIVVSLCSRPDVGAVITLFTTPPVFIIVLRAFIFFVVDSRKAFN